jgi:hypothetical protein
MRHKSLIYKVLVSLSFLLCHVATGSYSLPPTTAQRALDIDDSHRKSVLTVLRVLKIPGDWVHGVEEVPERKGDEQSQLCGESLPIGLRLVPPSE